MGNSPIVCTTIAVVRAFYFVIHLSRKRIDNALMAQVRSCGNYGEQRDTGVGFLLVIWFPLPVIPPTALHSSSSVAGIIGQMVADIQSGLRLPPPPKGPNRSVRAIYILHNYRVVSRLLKITMVGIRSLFFFVFYGVGLLAYPDSEFVTRKCAWKDSLNRWLVRRKVCTALPTHKPIPVWRRVRILPP
jgi:hypothetical protein